MKKINLILIAILAYSGAFGQSTKKVLVEEFSSTACGVCPPRTKQLITWDAQSPNRILVVHHSPTNDNMTNQTPALNLSSDYTINFQPAVVMNRKKFANCTTLHVPVNTAFFDSCAVEETQQAKVTISFANIAYNEATREVSGTINVQFLNSMNGNYRVGLYIVENQVAGETGPPTMQAGNPNATTITGVKAYDQKCYDATWAATNYPGYPYTDGCIVGYPHYNVVRFAVFGTYGDANTIPANPPAGVQYSKPFTYTIPANYDPTAAGHLVILENIRLLAFVAQYDTDKFNRNILNSEIMDLLTTPAQPSVISGPTAPCCNSTNLTYSVNNVAGVAYNWVLPIGWVQTAGGTTNSITVTAGATGGTISVTPSNSYGNGTPQTLTVTTSTLPAQPSAISGATTTNQNTSGLIYSVINTSGVNYTWSVPSGWAITAGQNTNCITVTAGSTSGNITVIPNNTCGNGSAQNLYVSVGTTPPPFVLQFSYNGQNINANDTIVISQPCTTAIIQIPIAVTNSTTSDAFVKVKRVLNTSLNNTSNYYTWTAVYDTSVNTSPDSLLIQAGQTVNNFEAYYLPHNQIGQTIINYQFYRIDNPNTFHQITIKFTTMPVVTELPLTAIYNNQIIAQNGIISIADTANIPELEALVVLQNTGTNAVMVKVKKIENSVVSGTQNYFCWGACYGFTIYESLDSILIEPGAFCYDFSSHYEPHNTVGESSITYQFFQSAAPQIYKTFEIKYITTVDIKDNNDINNDFKIYPTVTRDYVNVIGTQNINEIKLYSAFGQQVLGLQPKEKETKINIQNLSPGIYYVHISTLAKAFIHKIIILHH